MALLGEGGGHIDDVAAAALREHPTNNSPGDVEEIIGISHSSHIFDSRYLNLNTESTARVPFSASDLSRIV